MPSFDMVDLQVMCIGCIGAAAAILSGAGAAAAAARACPEHKDPATKRVATAAFPNVLMYGFSLVGDCHALSAARILLIQRPQHNARRRNADLTLRRLRGGIQADSGRRDRTSRPAKSSAR